MRALRWFTSLAVRFRGASMAARKREKYQLPFSAKWGMFAECFLLQITTEILVCLHAFAKQGHFHLTQCVHLFIDAGSECDGDKSQKTAEQNFNYQLSELLYMWICHVLQPGEDGQKKVYFLFPISDGSHCHFIARRFPVPFLIACLPMFAWVLFRCSDFLHKVQRHAVSLWQVNWWL